MSTTEQSAPAAVARRQVSPSKAEVAEARALSKEVGLDYVDLDRYPLNAAAKSLLPEQVSRRHHALAIGWKYGTPVVAVARPDNVMTMDDLRTIVGRDIHAVVACESQIDAYIERMYGRGDVAATGHTRPMRAGAESTMKTPSPSPSVLDEPPPAPLPPEAVTQAAAVPPPTEVPAQPKAVVPTEVPAPAKEAVAQEADAPTTEPAALLKPPAPAKSAAQTKLAAPAPPETAAPSTQAKPSAPPSAGLGEKPVPPKATGQRRHRRLPGLSPLCYRTRTSGSRRHRGPQTAGTRLSTWRSKRWMLSWRQQSSPQRPVTLGTRKT